MLNSFPISLIAGVILGTLAGMGIGGGTLLILWLTVVLGLPSQTARAINLMFFITAAGTVTLTRLRKGSVPIAKLIPGIVAGCIAAAVMSALRQGLPAQWLRRLFGSLLVITGVRELLYRPKKAK